MIKRAFVPVSLLVVLLSGCSSGGNDDPVPGGDPGVSPEVPDGSGDPGEVPETLVEGVWESPCLPAAGSAAARRFVISVQEGDADLLFNYLDTTYGETMCLDGDALYEIDTRGTFSEQLFETGQDPADGIPIDLAVDTVLLRPRISQVAETFNAEALCNSTNWAANVDQDIAGCDDQSGTLGVSTEAPRTDYNLFLVDDGGTPDLRADDQLLLGTLDAQTDPEARPTAVGQEVVFTRRAGSLARPGIFDAGL